MYSSKGYYYFAVVEDLFLRSNSSYIAVIVNERNGKTVFLLLSFRFSWAVASALNMSLDVSSDLLTSVASPLEVFRRFVWNFFRLENEHLNNCGRFASPRLVDAFSVRIPLPTGNFRAVRDISVAPIDASDQSLIIRMMDEADGVTAIRRKGKGGKGAGKKQEALTPLLEAVENAI